MTSDKDKTVIPLRCWSFVDNARKRLTGKVQDGRQIVTSPIVKLVGSRTYETKSGSVYRLTGPAWEGFAGLRSLSDLPYDDNNPIGFIPDPITTPKGSTP